jgi:hypothetical protein
MKAKNTFYDNISGVRVNVDGIKDKEDKPILLWKFIDENKTLIEKFGLKFVSEHPDDKYKYFIEFQYAYKTTDLS